MSDLPEQPSPEKLIADYVAGTGKIRAAVAGMTEEQLRARPVLLKWTTQELVMHVVDAEDAFVDRMRRIIAMDTPSLEAWHETKFVDRLHYEKQSVEDAILRFEAGRRNMTRILQALQPKDFDRAGLHSERGLQTLPDVIGFASWHLDHHLKFIPDKRKALGIPLKA